MNKKSLQLTENTVKMSLAFEDIKRCLQSNMDYKDKVYRIEGILKELYV